MRLQIVAVGRLKSGPERELTERYVGRAQALCRSVGIAGLDQLEVPEGSGRSTGERQRAEADRILVRVGSSPFVAFDERGSSPSSAAFAAAISVGRDAARGSLPFVVGGPDGLDEDVRRRAERLISFGQLTLPHGIVRVLVAEQLYRALTILAGHPYHRDG